MVLRGLTGSQKRAWHNENIYIFVNVSQNILENMDPEISLIQRIRNYRANALSVAASKILDRRQSCTIHGRHIVGRTVFGSLGMVSTFLTRVSGMNLVRITLFLGD